MAHAKVKAEMRGTTSRWGHRNVIKFAARKERRRNDREELAERLSTLEDELIDKLVIANDIWLDEQLENSRPDEPTQWDATVNWILLSEDDHAWSRAVERGDIGED